MSGASDILKERNYQINERGFDKEHDSQHTVGELMDAAWYYVTSGRTNWPFIDGRPDLSKISRREQLVCGGAMIAAAIDRIDNS